LFSLPGVAAGEFCFDCAFDGGFVEAPGWTDEIVGGGVAADALDDHRGGQELQKIDHRADVIVALHERDCSRRDFLGEPRVLHAVQVVNLHRVDVHPGEFPRGGEHVGVGFSRQAKHDVGADFKAATTAALDRVEERIVVMPAIHPIERAIVHGLHAVLDGDIGAGSDFFQQIEHVVGDTIAARADGESHDLGVAECFLVEGA